MTENILITGRPGIGKTTVVRKVLAGGIQLAGGFLTEEMREGHRRAGFRVTAIHSKQESILAHIDREGSPRVGRYGVDLRSFERVGVQAVLCAMDREGGIIIDEIGKMELCSHAFRDAAQAAIDSDHPVLATIPVHRHSFLDALRDRRDVQAIEVTVSNRNGLPQQLVSLVRR